jgi:hypothetical protein
MQVGFSTAGTLDELCRHETRTAWSNRVMPQLVLSLLSYLYDHMATVQAPSRCVKKN